MSPSESDRGPGADSGQITRLLSAVRSGDQNALDLVFNMVYGELHTAARRQLARARPGQTLNTTALVHEAYLKLVGSAHAEWSDRSHFLAVAAKAMRQIIIDYARWASRKKRGGGVQRITLDSIDVADEERASELVALDAALTRLESFSDRLARLVELRFFAGLSVEETADALGVAPHHIKRDWRKARAFLLQDMQDSA
ncbi:MAG TPA: sigma-70 family RNA polymerase sigma factor [Vicinamibacterales bacterium]|jgi:RNA polymerase sigma factor (TIGR02999 family)|nr:sigma-70 family RNA polymerase sigma factor [Vicinamibacterales bacterium]